MQTADALQRTDASHAPRNNNFNIVRFIAAFLVLAGHMGPILGIAAPFAIAYVEPIRVRVMQLLIDIKDDHTELLFIEDTDAEFYVPEGYREKYYPSYIPDGFELIDIGMWGDEATYRNKDDAFINYGEYDADDEIDINTEGAALSHAVVNGADAFVAEQETYVIITWAFEDKYFVIIADTSLDEALKVARSVRQITYSD